MKTYKEFITESKSIKTKLSDFENAYKEAKNLNPKTLESILNSSGYKDNDKMSNVVTDADAELKGGMLIFKTSFTFYDGEKSNKGLVYLTFDIASKKWIKAEF